MGKSSTTTDLVDIDEIKFTCDICDHALIDTVETSCGHTYCTFCLYMWKKYDSLCPMCGKAIGKVILRPDVDTFISEFFETANPFAKSERELYVDARRASEKNYSDIQTVLFSHSSIASRSRPLSQRRGREPQPQPRIIKPAVNAKSQTQKPAGNSKGQPYKPSATNSNKDDRFLKLNRETVKLEKELKGVYERIFNLGQSINAEEDVLAPKYLSPNPINSPARNIKRPSTAAAPGFRVSKMISNYNDKLEVDELLEQTDEMIWIEKFMNKYTFDNLKEMDEIGLFTEQGKDFLEEQEPHALTNDPNVSQEIRNTKPLQIHPYVQEYLKTMKIKTNITPCVPNEGGDGDQDKLFIRNPTTPVNSESIAQLERCRESLLKIRERSCSENVEEPCIGIQPSGSETRNSQLKLPKIEYTQSSEKVGKPFPKLNSCKGAKESITRVQPKTYSTSTMRGNSIKPQPPKKCDNTKLRKLSPPPSSFPTSRRLPPFSQQSKQGKGN